MSALIGSPLQNVEWRNAPPQGAKASPQPAGPLSYADVVLGYSPDLYWPMQETIGTNADDASPNNRDGTYGSGVTLNQSGLLTEIGDKAVLLDGTGNTGISLTYTGVYTNGERKLLVGWATLADNTGDRYLFGDGGGNIFLQIPSGTTNARFAPRAGFAEVTWSSAFPLSTVVMWALDFDEPNDTAELWINGISKGSLALVSTWPGGAFLLGRSYSLAGWQGKMGHAAVFTGQPDPAAVVADLYAAGIA